MLFEFMDMLIPDHILTISNINHYDQFPFFSLNFNLGVRRRPKSLYLTFLLRSVPPVTKVKEHREVMFLFDDTHPLGVFHHFREREHRPDEQIQSFERKVIK